jgi:hypothetical protein
MKNCLRLASAVRLAGLCGAGFGSDSEPGYSHLVGEIPGPLENRRRKRRSGGLPCNSRPQRGRVE